MNNRSNTTRLIAAGVFLLLAIAAILLITNSDGEETAADGTPTPTPAPLFTEAQFGAVVGLTVTENATGRTLIAHTDDGNEWIIDQLPEDAEVSESAVVDHQRLRGAVASLPTLRPRRVLTDVDDLSAFGLSEPTYTVSFELADDSTYTFDVGERAPAASAYYVLLEDRADTVHLVGEFSLQPLFEILNEPPYIEPTPQATATSEG